MTSTQNRAPHSPSEPKWYHGWRMRARAREWRREYHNYVLLIWLRIHTQLCLFVWFVVRLFYLCVYRMTKKNNTNWNGKKNDEKEDEKNVLRARKVYETATMAYRQQCCSHQQHTSSTAATHNPKWKWKHARTQTYKPSNSNEEIRRDREKRSNNSYGGDSGSWCDMCHVCTSIWCSTLRTAIDPLLVSIAPAIRTYHVVNTQTRFVRRFGDDDMCC